MQRVDSCAELLEKTLILDKDKRRLWKQFEKDLVLLHFKGVLREIRLGL